MNKFQKITFLLPLILLAHFIYSKLYTAYNHSTRFIRGSEVFFIFSDDYLDEDLIDLVPSIKDWNIYLNEQESLLNFNEETIFRGQIEKGDKNSICFDMDVPTIIIEVYKFSEEDLNFVDSFNILGLTNPRGDKYGNCTFQKIFLNYLTFLPYNKTAVFTHEIGHAIGLSHVKDDFSIMSTFYNPVVSFPTQFDIEEFCKIYKCTAKEKRKLSYVHLPEE